MFSKLLSFGSSVARCCAPFKNSVFNPKLNFMGFLTLHLSKIRQLVYCHSMALRVNLLYHRFKGIIVKHLLLLFWVRCCGPSRLSEVSAQLIWWRWMSFEHNCCRLLRLSIIGHIVFALVVIDPLLNKVRFLCPVIQSGLCNSSLMD